MFGRKIDHVQAAGSLLSLQHLRRFAKWDFLPNCLKHRLLSESSTKDETPHVSSITSVEKSPTLFFLVGLVGLISYNAVVGILSENGVAAPLHRIPVPATAPTNEDDTLLHSSEYWPTIYKKHNPNGPHPSIIARAEDVIRPLAHLWLQTAMKAGREAKENGIGENVGAVIVENTSAESAQVIAVAVDARFYTCDGGDSARNGNPMNHAVMRAIGLVARKRLSVLDDPVDQPHSKKYLDCPLLPMEENVFNASFIDAGGYLCTGLDLYLTHEPCVMCSMAILHSRFDKVIFRRRIPATGAAASELGHRKRESLGYGMFWRPELNWKLLAWEWVDEEETGDQESNPIHA